MSNSRSFSASLALKAGAVAAASMLALSACSSSSSTTAPANGGSSTAAAAAKAGTWEGDSATWSANLPFAINGFTKDGEKKSATSVDASYSDIHKAEVHFILCKTADDAACAGATKKKEYKGYTIAVTSSDAAALDANAESFFKEITRN